MATLSAVATLVHPAQAEEPGTTEAIPTIDPGKLPPDAFVDVAKVNPKIIVALPYATTNNFTKQKLYPIERCFLRAGVARHLDDAANVLAKKGFRIKIWDGYRPAAVQEKMWKAFLNSPYVANPKRGSRHSRGAAVDITLTDANGEELSMPTPYDTFSPRAHARANLTESKEDREAKLHREILQNAMISNGFQIMRTEWWHFDAIDYERFPLEDIPIEELARKLDSSPK